MGRSSSLMISDTCPSKMDSKLFQEYTTTYPPKVSFRERKVEVEEALMKPTITSSKTVVVDWSKTRQFRAELEQVTLTSPFDNLVELMPSPDSGLEMSTVK